MGGLNHFFIVIFNKNVYQMKNFITLVTSDFDQIPLYPPALFQNEYDGEGMSFVFYFKLSENYDELPLHFQENIRV